MSPTQYDSSVLQNFADDLYGQARVVIIITALKFGIIAFIVVLVGSSILSHSLPLKFDSPPVLIGVVAAAVGVSVGRDRAFQLKLQAQQTLCQRQIELNTRTQH